LEPIEYFAYGCTTLIFGIVAYYAYIMIWQPIKGGQLISQLITLYAPDDTQQTHLVFIGVAWDITGVVTSQDAALQRKRVRHRDLCTEIRTLKQMPVEKRPANWRIQLERRQLYVIALYREIKLSLAIGPRLRIIAFKTLGGKLLFLVQHHNLKPLNECATHGRGGGDEYVTQVAAKLGRGIVRVQLDEIPEPTADYWRRISNIRKRGSWFMVCPITRDQSYRVEPPARFAAEAVLTDQRAMRLIEMEKVFARRERNMLGMMERAKNEGVQAANTQQELEWAVAKWTGKDSFKVGGGGFTDTQTILITAGGAAVLGLVAGYFSGGGLIPTALGAGAGGVFAGLGVREIAAKRQ
jgi:hypothetical protein